VEVFVIVSEWVDAQEEERRAFLVVCTGNGQHEERTLAKFPVSPTFGVLASSTPRGDDGAAGGRRRSTSRPSYEVRFNSTGQVAGRFFHCRRCDRRYPMAEAEFVAGIEMLLAEHGDLSARRLDLSTPGATLL
jgi:hypothetical protein